MQSAMVENFSKDNYEYIGGPLGQHVRPPINEESDDDGHGRSSKIRNMEGRVSGKTTAKGGPLSNEEEYEEDEDGDLNHDYKNHRDDLMEDSQTALNNGDLSGVEMKARPQTAKVKNEDENVFYRREGGDKAGFNSTSRDPNDKSRETLQEGGEPENIDGHGGMRNERMVKTIVNDGQGRSFKKHRSQHGDGQEAEY